MIANGVLGQRRWTWQSIEMQALELVAEYCPNVLMEPQPVPVDYILETVLPKRFNVDLMIGQLPHPLEAAVSLESDGYTITLWFQAWAYDRLLRGQGRQRFTGCHEVGHIVLHLEEVRRALRSNAEPGLEPTGSVTLHSTLETQADFFASRLLMPTPSMRLATKSFTWPDARFISQTYGVSMAAANRRLREIGFR